MLHFFNIYYSQFHFHSVFDLEFDSFILNVICPEIYLFGVFVNVVQFADRVVSIIDLQKVQMLDAK